jgi:hypothetical protein
VKARRPGAADAHFLRRLAQGPVLVVAELEHAPLSFSQELEGTHERFTHVVGLDGHLAHRSAIPTGLDHIAVVGDSAQPVGLAIEASVVEA